MEKSNTWRTLFPNMQEQNTAAVRRKQMNNSHLESQLNDLFTSSGKVLPNKATIRKVDKNQMSKDNPLLSQSMFIPTEKPKKSTFMNKASRNNPLNYKAKPSKTEKIIRTKITESKVPYLPASRLPESPPRSIKTQNSETHFDFLPGSQFVKPIPVKKPLTKVLNRETKCSTDEVGKTSCKKLKVDKLANSFRISEQFA